MHKNIMEVGSRDSPLMLATGQYPQWRSRFLRYINTRPNGDALRKCIPNGPYIPTTVVVQAIAATDDSPAIPEHTTVETPMNISGNMGSYQKFTTRSHTTTGYKGKEIAKPITPPSKPASKEDSDPKQAQKDKDMQNNLALIAKYFKRIYKPTNNNLRTSSNSRNKNVDTTPRYKNDSQSGQFGNQRTMHVAGARENVGSLVVQQTGIQYTDEEIDEQELEAHYSYMAKIQENDQNDVESEDERVALANLIANLKHNTEFEKYKAFNDPTVDYDKLELVKEKHDELIKQSLLTKSHYEGLVKQKTKTCLMPLALKTHNDSFIFVHELKQEMHADLKYVESLEKEIDELESEKIEFSNMYDMILQECVSNEVMCSYLLSLSYLDVLAELQYLYLHKVKKCDCLAQKLLKQTESVSKEVHTELS
nr:hypothetical protein [Tanacetum cinerariifolium]